jgi:hypothetical protein
LLSHSAQFIGRAFIHGASSRRVAVGTACLAFPLSPIKVDPIRAVGRILGGEKEEGRAGWVAGKACWHGAGRSRWAAVGAMADG